MLSLEKNTDGDLCPRGDGFTGQVTVLPAVWNNDIIPKYGQYNLAVPYAFSYYHARITGLRLYCLCDHIFISWLIQYALSLIIVNLPNFLTKRRSSMHSVLHYILIFVCPGTLMHQPCSIREIEVGCGNCHISLALSDQM